MDTQTKSMLAWMEAQEKINRELIEWLMAVSRTTTPDVPFCVCASWKGHVEGLKYCARCGQMRGEEWSKAKQPITVAATPTADTPANRSAAPAPASTIPTTPASSPLVTQTEDAGPAGPGSECAHQWEYSDYDNLSWSSKNNWGRNWCMKCGALWQSGKILVPAAQPDSSTSPKQASSPYAGVYREASAPSRLSGWNEWECVVGHRNYGLNALRDDCCVCGRARVPADSNIKQQQP